MRRSILFLKIAGIVFFSLGAGILIFLGLYFMMTLCLSGVAALSVSLYRDQQKAVKRMEHLIATIHNGDLNVFYSTSSTNGEDRELARSMNEALTAFRVRLYNSIFAEAETEAWQKLIRVLTHEIMNSIAPVISLSETVTERAATNGMNERDYEIMLQAMQTIHRRSKGLLGFVENYRKLTRIPTPILRNFSLSDLFRDIRLLFPAESAFITITIIPDDLSLYADRALVEQVLINLLKNAIEACEETVVPRIQVEAIHQEGATKITVMDTGSGIVPEAIDKIFVPFFTTKTKGSGIGLSLCRQVMNRHSGSISVTSKVEKGTSFVLRFPVVANRLL